MKQSHIILISILIGAGVISVILIAVFAGSAAMSKKTTTTMAAQINSTRAP